MVWSAPSNVVRPACVDVALARIVNIDDELGGLDVDIRSAVASHTDRSASVIEYRTNPPVRYSRVRRERVDMQCQHGVSRCRYRHGSGQWKQDRQY
jgi:hypothetical protein